LEVELPVERKKQQNLGIMSFDSQLFAIRRNAKNLIDYKLKLSTKMKYWSE